MRATPYESVHRSVERLLFGEHTLQVRALYAQLGVAAPRLNREPDDHIGLELEFLATVTTAWRDATQAGDLPQAQAVLDLGGVFVRDHLLAWAPGLMDLITEHADTAFYQGVGRLGAAALDWLAVAEWTEPRGQ